MLDKVKEIKQILGDMRLLDGCNELYFAYMKIIELEQLVNNNCDLADISARTLGIESAANLINSMPTDQAIQQLKSEITGKPITEKIDGQLIVVYVR